MSYAIAVDIGGTFTDLVAFDHERHKVIYSKSATTYDNLVKGILDCFRKAEVTPADASLLNHGTTLVINSLIQRKGARAALVTSEGFRDILEIARGNRPDPFDLHYERDEPLIPRDLRFEVRERMGSQGEVVTALDAAALGELAGEVRKAGAESVAIFF
jgi:N-methylhydantoinase A